VQGTYSDVLVQLSNVYSGLRGDASGTKNEDAAQGFVRSTTKYWVRAEDVSNVKYHILQHLPVFQFDRDNFAGDAQLINSVYFDNDSLELYHGRLDKKPNAIALRIRWYGNGDPSRVFVERKTHRESWKGEESVKERFNLDERRVVPFLEMEYDEKAAEADLRSAGKSDKEIGKYLELFTEVRNQVDAKQLRPFIRTQYMRTAFQIPFDATVRVSMDTNLCMIKENPDEGPSCTVAGRWYRDPSLPVARTEVTRFPHAVLEVKLSLPEGQSAPSWVQELLDSGYLTEVHKFSKFIHGTCTLFPELVQAVPYWVDDESVRASMLASAPAPGAQAAAAAASGGGGGANGAGGGQRRRNDSDDEDGDEEAGTARSGRVSSFSNPDKPRKRLPATLEELRHPLLGDAPTLRLLPGRDAVRGFGGGRGMTPRGTHYADDGEDDEGGPPFLRGLRRRLMALLGPPPGGYRRLGGGGGGAGGVAGGSPVAGVVPMRLEPKTFLANERTFLSWLHMSVTIGSIAAALLSFAGTAPSGAGGGGSGGASGDTPLSAHLVEVIALILLPLAIAMCAYAVFIFVWRGQMIARKRPGHFDDRLGPLGLCCCVVLALSAIFVVSLIDYAEVSAPPPVAPPVVPPPAPPFVPPPPPVPPVPPGPPDVGPLPLAAVRLEAARDARRQQIASAAGGILPFGRLMTAMLPRAA
jgi:uncharacterized membrane protein YidH (DUF202 family)